MTGVRHRIVDADPRKVEPSVAERFLRSFASSARAHYTEQGLRLLVGAALVNFASSMWHAELFTLLGWLIVVTAMSTGDMLTLGTIVADQTGLRGRYTMELDYPFPVQRPCVPAAPAEFGLPSLSTAVEEQWGLRIVPGKGPFRLVVVESAQLPSAN